MTFDEYVKAEQEFDAKLKTLLPRELLKINTLRLN